MDLNPDIFRRLSRVQIDGLAGLEVKGAEVRRGIGRDRCPKRGRDVVMSAGRDPCWPLKQDKARRTMRSHRIFTRVEMCAIISG